MKKLKLPETKISKVSLALVVKLAVSVLLVILPVIFANASQMSIPLWIVASFEIIIIGILMAYAVIPAFKPKVAFGITISLSIFLILVTRVVFVPEFHIPVLKYSSQILSVVAICFLVELNRYIDSYKTFKWLALTIFGLLLAVSGLVTLDFYKSAGAWTENATGVWMVFITVICVLITYNATIKKKSE